MSDWLWNSNETLLRFLDARVGDLHTILDLQAREDLQAALDRDDAEDEHRWERLLALNVAQSHFKIENVDTGGFRQGRAKTRRRDAHPPRAADGAVARTTRTSAHRGRST
jgi:hypothetical protein